MMLPRYRDIKSQDVPEVELENGVKVKIIAGKVNGKQGAVRDIVIDPEYLDVTVPPEAIFTHATLKGHTAFAYVIGGEGHFDQDKKSLLGNGTVCLYNDGDSVSIAAGKEGVRFLLISGKPIREPIAWYGPIVMRHGRRAGARF